MKKVLLSLLAVCLLAVSLTACSGGGATPSTTVNMEQLQKAMLAADPTLAKDITSITSNTGDASEAKKNFSYFSTLDYEKVDRYLLSYSSSGTADEIAVIAVKDAADVSEAASAPMWTTASSSSSSTAPTRPAAWKRPRSSPRTNTLSSSSAKTPVQSKPRLKPSSLPATDFSPNIGPPAVQLLHSRGSPCFVYSRSSRPRSNKMTERPPFSLYKLRPTLGPYGPGWEGSSQRI